MDKPYTIKEGESLWGIARKHNVTLGELLKVNPQFSTNGRNPDLIYPGEDVAIPDKSNYSQNTNLKTGCQKCASKTPQGQPKKFATAEEAATDAMKNANPKSVSEGREYGGWVKKNSDGTYSYDPPVQGSKDGLPNMPNKGPSDEVWYHTHGAADPGYDNENFSGMVGDKGYSKANSAVGYLATPSGVIKKYDPATNSVTTLSETAPP